MALDPKLQKIAALLPEFCRLLESQMNADVMMRHPILHEGAQADGRRGYHEIGYDNGKRFWKVWTFSGNQHMVRYFVEKKTGIIFGAKGWNAYNPNHEYGTLDTMHEWDWSGYYAKNKHGKDSLVPKEMRK